MTSWFSWPSYNSESFLQIFLCRNTIHRLFYNRYLKFSREVLVGKAVDFLCPVKFCSGLTEGENWWRSIPISLWLNLWAQFQQPAEQTQPEHSHLGKHLLQQYCAENLEHLGCSWMIIVKVKLCKTKETKTSHLCDTSLNPAHGISDLFHYGRKSSLILEKFEPYSPDNLLHVV